jgi:hypothetical protein
MIDPGRDPFCPSLAPPLLHICYSAAALLVIMLCVSQCLSCILYPVHNIYITDT